MKKRAISLAREAEESARNGNIAHAIWLAENANTLADESDVRRIAGAVFRVHEEQIRICEAQCQVILIRLSKMIEYSTELMPEEWMAVISDLSMCHAFSIFAERLNYPVNTMSVRTVMEKLETATDGFRYPPFVRQLRAARKRYPNPLPPPL